MRRATTSLMSPFRTHALQQWPARGLRSRALVGYRPAQTTPARSSVDCVTAPDRHSSVALFEAAALPYPRIGHGLFEWPLIRVAPTGFVGVQRPRKLKVASVKPRTGAVGQVQATNADEPFKSLLSSFCDAATVELHRRTSVQCRFRESVSNLH
jgi:hypothetical protein